jgi:hypothetical protein
MPKTITVTSTFRENLAKAQEGISPLPINAVPDKEYPATPLTEQAILSMDPKRLKALLRIAPELYAQYKCTKSAQQNEEITYTEASTGRERRIRVPLFEPFGEPFTLVDA